jgi:CSLREA domain-containing protein
MKLISRLFRLFFALTLLCGVWAIAPTQTAQAVPPQIIVSIAADELDGGSGNSHCSLREAITNINNANQGQVDCATGSLTSIITLPAGTYQLTLAGANEDVNATGDLDIRANLTINGAGAGSTFIQAGTNDTNGIDRVLHLPVAGVTVVLNDLTIRYGRAPNGADGTPGSTGANGGDGTPGDPGSDASLGADGADGYDGNLNGSEGDPGGSDGTSGSDGTPGDDGGFGASGGAGADGSSGGGIYSLANLTLNRCVIIDNHAGDGGLGGHGGDGGNGGRGGDGGKGGRGGDGGRGGAAYNDGNGNPANGGKGGAGSDGSKGGTGGSGGNGGPGGSGGKGGNGGSGGGIFQVGAMLNLHATTLHNNHTGAGGAGGPGGTGGLSGAGGSRGPGGDPGEGGAGGYGQNGGDDGKNGLLGKPGLPGDDNAGASSGSAGGVGDAGSTGSGGGLYNDGGTLNMLGSLVGANTALTNTGAGLANINGAIANIANTTFSGNIADPATGDIIHNQNSEIVLSSSTLIANTSSYTLWSGSGATIQIKNTIIKDGGNSCWNEGTIANASNNFLGSDCDGSGGADDVNTVSNIKALANNGGSTDTHALNNDSNAIDAVIDCTYLSSGTNPLFSNGDAISIDQRGQPRNDLACDVGAFELQLTDPGGSTVIKEFNSPGVFTFGPTRVQIQVTDTGYASLTSLAVTHVNGNHAAAQGTFGGLNGVGWDEYWSIDTNGGAFDFKANLTLPTLYAASDTTRVCRYTSLSGWECSDHNNGYTANSVTRDDISEFSDWAVGYNVSPTAVTLHGISARSVLPWPSPAFGLLILIGLAGVLSLRRKAF